MFNLVLISHRSVFLSNFLKIKSIHQQIHSFHVVVDILSQGVQFSAVSEIFDSRKLIVIPEIFIQSCTRVQWKLIVLISTLPHPMCSRLPNLNFIVMTTFCSWNHFYRNHLELHEHSSARLHTNIVDQEDFPKPGAPASKREVPQFIHNFFVE